MKSCKKNKTGLTLIEMLIVVGIIAILVSMVIGIAGRIDTQGKEQLAESTIAILTAALGQFRDYGYNYDNSVVDYSDFKFPLDCNDFEKVDLQTTLSDALGTNILIDASGHDRNYSGSEVLYFFLSRVPESRKTLDQIDSSLVTNKGSNKQPMSITVDTRSYPLLRIIDSWGKTLQYSYYRNQYEPLPSSEPEANERRNFPVIISAGPDGKFGNDDDITSR